MAEQRRSSGPVVAVVAAVLLGSAAAFMREPDWSTFLAFAILIGASELFEVTLPSDVRYSLGLAPALGLALLGTIRPEADHAPFNEVLVAFALGAVLATAARALRRRDLRLAETGSHTLALAAGVAVYRAIAPNDQFVFDIDSSGATDISVVGFAAMFLTVLLIETVLQTVRRVERERVAPLPVFRGVLGATFALDLSVASVGALLAVAYPALEFWAFPLFLAPLGATQFAFKQFSSIRKTYLQTIRALSKVPEMAGYTHPGHSTRVAELSVAIARELGVAEHDISEIEYAALLHDIGRVSLPDPLEEEGLVSKEQLATVGGAIIRETGHFPKVADMIERQHNPYRQRGEGPTTTLPVGAKIIKVASAFDDLLKPGGIGLPPSDALDRLSLDMAFEYDPEVVQGLRRVLEKQGRI